LKVTIPTPPSTNAIWRAVNGRVIKSAEYRAWITQAGLVLMSQRPKSVTGPCNVRVCCETNGRRDLDGYLKATLDLLVTHKLIDSDRCKTVRQITLDWSDEVKGVEVCVVKSGDSPAVCCHGDANHGINES
jgi:Holliday junction resolvase RusA-like endonuclease